MSAALEAGRELDALVAEKVMGWGWRRSVGAPAGWRGPNGDTLGPWRWLVSDTSAFTPARGDEMPYLDNLPRFSSDITDAWLVVEKMQRDGFDYWIGNLHAATHERVPQGAAFYCDGIGFFESGDTETVPLAICKAALATVNAGRGLREGDDA